MNTLSLPNEHTKKRLELLQSKGRFSEEEKNDLFHILIGSDEAVKEYNAKDKRKQKSTTSLHANRKMYDRKINKSLRDYSTNQNAEEDIEWQKSLGGYSKKQAIKQEKTKDKEIKNEKNRAELSPEDKESITKGLKELIKYVRSYTNIRKEKYLNQRQNWSQKQKNTVENIETESGNKVKCLVDKKFIELFRKVQGIHYRGGAVLGEWAIVDDPKTLEDEPFLRHEAIHCAQQREMGGVGKKGFIRWIAISGIDLAKKQFLSEVRGLDETADFATDNQITDYETYMNQFTPGYLKTRKPFAYKKYADPKFRRQEFERIRTIEYKELQQKRERLQKELPYAFTPNKRALVLQKLEDTKQELKQMEKMINKLKNDNEIRAVMIQPDVPNIKKGNQKFPVWTESETNRRIRIPMEHFIQKYGREEDGYVEGVELWLAFQSILREITQKNKGDKKQIKNIEKECKAVIAKYGKVGLEQIKAKYDI